MTERDQADIRKADAMIALAADLTAQGRRLRRQVFARVRQRNWRTRHANPTKETTDV
jgi:hypothetical protein